MVTANVSTLVFSESTDFVEEILEEAETEEKSNKNAITEEDDEEDPVEENDEEVSDEEILDEEEEEENDEEEENNNENQIEEIIIEEKREGNNNDENVIQEVAEENKEEEKNNDNAIQEELAKEKTIGNAIEEELSIENKEEVKKEAEKKEEEKKEEEKKEAEKKAEEKKEEGKTKPVSNPAKKLRKRIRKKKNTDKDEAKPETSVKKPAAKKAKTLAIAKVGEEEGPTSVTKEEKEGEKGKDKPKTPGKKKASANKVESMGMIFMCSSKTKKDCYQYNVFGLPAGKKETVQKIYKGMRLFLYDIDLKLMYGIYKASAPGGFNLEPKAFNSAYPSQVRFTVMEDCEPLGEEKFKSVIKENYYSKNKFNPQLNSAQVKNLCKLFAFANKSSTPKSKKPVRSLKSAHDEPRQPSGRGGKIRKRVQDEPKRLPRSPRLPAWRNPDRRPVDGRAFDRRPFDRRPVDYRPDDRRVVYEREAFVQPPPPVVPPLSYSFETEAYRRDLPPLDNRGRSYLDYEQTSRDRYYYREREPISYAREYGYAPAPAAAEYNYLPAPAMPLPRYSYPDPTASEYRSTEGMRADYRIPAAAEGRYSDYGSSARDRMYRL